MMKYTDALERQSVLLLAVLVLLAVTLRKLLKIGSREPDLPPGPPTIPVFGNMLQVPSTQTEWQLTEWHKQYGPIYSLKMANTTMVIIKDREAIRDLWEKQSSIYSDRMESYVAELMHGLNHVTEKNMGEEWKDRRKLISHFFSPQMLTTKHCYLQEAEARAFLKQMALEPDRVFENCKRFSSAITGALVYGRRPKTFEDHLCQNVVEAMGLLSENMEFGATPPVDEWPFKILRWTPVQMAFWKRRALQSGQKMDALWQRLWNEMIARRARGEHRDSLFDKFLDDEEHGKTNWKWGAKGIRFLGGEIVEAGADTTSSTLLSFVMAMANFPDIQCKAQKMIDEVVGSDRSPNWDDYDALPYIAQIQKEVLRWRPVTTLGSPHVSREERWYKGYRIPKGTRTVQNTWAMHQDSDFYTEPEKFNPDRYEGKTRLADHYAGTPDWKSRDHYSYGGGRRICPGIHMAERNLWRAISKMVWAFNIEPPINPKTGKPEPLNTAAFSVNGEKSAYAPGAVRIPLDFKVRISPRSEQHIRVIEREYIEAIPTLEKYE